MPSKPPDAVLRQAIIGTWQIDFGPRDLPRAKAFSTYRADGTFDQLTFLMLAGNLSRTEVRGQWRIESGFLTERITKAAISKIEGYKETSEILSIDRGTLVFRGNNQQLKLRRSRLPANLPPVAPWFAAAARWAELESLALETPKPEYPERARALRIQGWGFFRLQIGRGGEVASVQTTKSTGSEILDRYATTALKRWRFKPGTLNEAVVPLIFNLSER